MTVKPRFIGCRIHHLDHCESTNDVAAQLLKQGDVQEGTIIVTSKQMNGRGQRGNTWVSNPGENLIASIILKPVFLDVQQQFYLNMVTSLAVNESLAHLGVTHSSIKWPNDLLIRTNKICGILIENTLRKGFESAVVGIGINVNQQAFHGLRATSVSVELGRQIPVDDIFGVLNPNMEEFYERLRNKEFNLLKKKYLQHLYGLNRTMIFDDGEQFQGEVVGISEFGQLQIKKHNQIKSYNMQEVRFQFEAEL